MNKITTERKLHALEKIGQVDYLVQLEEQIISLKKSRDAYRRQTVELKREIQKLEKKIPQQNGKTYTKEQIMGIFPFLAYKSYKKLWEEIDID
jgi:uncharacterized protein YjhX (UPF0386 family)